MTRWITDLVCAALRRMREDADAKRDSVFRQTAAYAQHSFRSATEALESLGAT